MDINYEGEILEKKGDLQGALKKYEEAVKLNPRSAYLLAFLGKAYNKMGNDDKALRTYQEALSKSPQHFWVHYLIGQLYRDEGRYAEAIGKFEELVSMKDNSYASNKLFHYTRYQDVSYGELGYCYAKLGQRQKSLDAYQQYLLRNPLAPDRKSVEDYIQRLKFDNNYDKQNSKVF